MQKSRWNFIEDTSKITQKEIQNFARKLNVSPMIATLLLRRNISDEETARKFLETPSEKSFLNPFLLRDMTKAAARIKKAIDDQEIICIYGDYDVDGMTATSILLRAFKNSFGVAKEKLFFYVPDRESEGYGLNLPALKKIRDEFHATLIITVDCGITSVHEIEEMKNSLDIIVTDHHLPEKSLPNAFAVIDPHRENDIYPEQNLCGAGVAFKLCQAIFQTLTGKKFSLYQNDLDLVTLGTVADLVPLVGENRTFVKIGLEKMSHDEASLGLQSLINVSDLQSKTISAGHVGFVLAPKLNAAGRIDKPIHGVQLLTSENPDEAADLAHQLARINSQRQSIEQEIFDEADKLISQQDKKNKVLVVTGKNWNLGIIGLVASRLTEKYYRPSVVISLNNGEGRASCRSIRGFHIFDALNAFHEKLIRYGGHSMAAGFSILEENIPLLIEHLNDWADKHLSEEDLLQTIDIDFRLNPKDLTIEFIDELKLLQPFGIGNATPLFGVENIFANQVRTLGTNGKHLQLVFDNNIKAVAWNDGALSSWVQSGAIDMAYTPEINVWQGVRSPQCFIKLLREAHSRQQFPLPKEKARELLKTIYLFWRKEFQKCNGEKNSPLEDFLMTSSKDSHFAFSMQTLEIAFKIFQDLTLMDFNPHNNQILFSLHPTQKFSLDTSPTFQKNTFD